MAKNRKKYELREICSKKEKSDWTHNMGFVQGSFERQFEKWGRAVSRFPWLTIFGSIACFGLLGLGTLNLRTESDYDRLWYNRRSAVWRQFRYGQRAFDATGGAWAIFEIKNLSKQTLLEALELHASIAEAATWPETCLRTWGPCETRSVLNLWENNRTKLEGDPDVLGTLSVEPLWDPVLREPTSLDTQLSDVLRVQGKIVSASGLQLIYETEDDDSFVGRRFASDVLEACDDFGSRLGSQVSCAHSRSYQEVSDQEIEENSIFVTLAMVVMIVYVTAHEFKLDGVRSRSVLGSTVVLTVALALAFAFGIGGLVGIPFNPLSLISILVLLGVGVDDMIIIIDAVRRHGDIPAALSDVGASILLSSLTDFAALLVGSFVDIPAISWFCLTAALAIVAVFLIQISFFVGCVVIDGRRIKARRRDLCCCFVKANEDIEEPAKNVVMPRVARFVTASTRRATCIVVCFLAAAASFAAVIALRLERGTNWDNYLPSGSYLLDYYDARDRTFGDMVPVDFVSGRVWVDRAGHRAALADMTRRASEISQVSEPVYGWYEAWTDYTSNYTFASLEAFLATDDGRAYEDDVVLGDGTVEFSRLRVVATFPKNTNAQVRLMRRIRNEAKRNSGVKFRATANNFNWLERYRNVPELAMVSLAGTMAAAVLLCGMLVPSWATTALVFVSLAMVQNSMIAITAAVGFRLNTITVLYLIMSIGFSVDYAAHIAFACAEQATKAAPAAAVHIALTEIGTSVLHGGCSTVLAVAVLSFSSFYAYRQLTIMFLAMVVSGLLHGIFFIPAAHFLFHTMALRRRLRVEAAAVAKAAAVELQKPDDDCEVRLSYEEGDGDDGLEDSKKGDMVSAPATGARTGRF